MTTAWIYISMKYQKSFNTAKAEFTGIKKH